MARCLRLLRAPFKSLVRGLPPRLLPFRNRVRSNQIERERERAGARRPLVCCLQLKDNASRVRFGDPSESASALGG